MPGLVGCCRHTKYAPCHTKYAPCAAGDKREVTTIYEIVQDKDGATVALPDYQFVCECWQAGSYTKDPAC
jgi:hypothetical protein